MEAYISALCDEIRSRGREINRLVDHIYLGGGTPSIAHYAFPKIKRAIEQSFTLRNGVEISCECNPESVTPDFIAAAKEFGVNRVSLGVQSLSDPLLKRIGRAHDRARALSALDQLTKSFSSVNADLMVGLPGQRESDLDETLELILSYPLNHVSCYSLILEEGTRLFEEAKRGEFVLDEDFSVDLYDRARARLEKAGFSRYEISNFCRNEAVCGYNASVWQYGDYLGLGLGASSFLKRGDRDLIGVRHTNTSDLAKYVDAHGMMEKERFEIRKKEGMFEFIMLGLRLEEGINLNRFREIFFEDFFDLFGENLDGVKQYLRYSSGRLAIKPEYFYISNSIIEEIID